MTLASAVAKGIHLSAQKGRLVADLIRGMSVSEALLILQFCPKKGARIMRKVLLSAVANAEQNHGMEVSNLKIFSVMVDRGTFMRRFMARAKGRGVRIMKPTCHIKLTVSVN